MNYCYAAFEWQDEIDIFLVLQGISMLFVIKQLHTKGIYETTTAQFKIDIGKR